MCSVSMQNILIPLNLFIKCYIFTYSQLPNYKFCRYYIHWKETMCVFADLITLYKIIKVFNNVYEMKISDFQVEKDYLQ